MSRGGLRRSKEDGSINHLYKSKWRLGKTTAIRIPEAIKDCLINLAKCIDEQKIVVENSISLAEKLINYDQLKMEVIRLKNQNSDQQQQLNKLTQQIENLTNDKSKENNLDNYQIAVDCFVKYVENKNLSLDDLNKSRKGSKNHQLWEIKTWFESKISNG